MVESLQVTSVLILQSKMLNFFNIDDKKDYSPYDNGIFYFLSDAYSPFAPMFYRYKKGYNAIFVLKL